MSCQGTFFNVRVRIAVGQYVVAVLRAVGQQTLGAVLALLREDGVSRASVVQRREDDGPEAAGNVGDSMEAKPQPQEAVCSNKDTKDMGRSKLHPC